jgi:CRISPR-associated protein Cmr2
VIGLSAGVLIAPENTPIFFLDRLVEELLKSAKDRAKVLAREKFYGGAVDFMALKSITMVTDKIKAFREAAYGTGKHNVRTARPYSWHEFAGLLDTVRALKRAQVPRSQLYRLRRALDDDADTGAPLVSVMEYLYTRARQPAYSQALIDHVERPWCYRRGPTGRPGLPPWMARGEKEWETIWADMLEIHELVPEQPHD